MVIIKVKTTQIRSIPPSPRHSRSCTQISIVTNKQTTKIASYGTDSFPTTFLRCVRCLLASNFRQRETRTCTRSTKLEEQYSEFPASNLLNSGLNRRRVGVGCRCSEIPRTKLFQTFDSFPALSSFTAFESKRNCLACVCYSCLVHSLGNKLPSPLHLKNTSNNHQQQRSHTIISLRVWAVFLLLSRHVRSPFVPLFS